ncbi:uncharacterized protein LOC134248324 [Saccostrea cucullata]|uniref:uncharacterized protein LOC134248324 n=1 Tax=Saccostrea cuccullata TaxID=36930 RepID=UPI002ED09A0B
MDSDDDKQSKVVRYSGSTDKQSIQFDNEGKNLYSSGYIKNISENRNLDICVADFKPKQWWWLIRQETPFSTLFIPLLPWGILPAGITTDSQSQILTSDRANPCIHILNNGHFPRYIDNCGLKFKGFMCSTRKPFCDRVGQW